MMAKVYVTNWSNYVEYFHCYISLCLHCLKLNTYVDTQAAQEILPGGNKIFLSTIDSLTFHYNNFSDDVIITIASLIMTFLVISSFVQCEPPVIATLPQGGNSSSYLTQPPHNHMNPFLFSETFPSPNKVSLEYK